MGGIAVIGCAGGVGTTLVAAALALARRPVRVMGLDGHGGGPHVLWGLSPERTVDNLAPVRGEVDGSHVDHIVHRSRAGIEVVAGPGDPVATAAWADDAAGLATALAGSGAWIADLGRGDHCIARALLARADVAVLVAAAGPAALATCALRAGALPAGCRAVPVMVRRRDESLSARVARRIIGRDVLEIPWDRSGAERCAAAGEPGTRGLWKVLADVSGVS